MIHDHLSQEKKGLLALHDEMITTTIYNPNIWGKIRAWLELVDSTLVWGKTKIGT